jgi:Ca2+-transporting ATPase
MSILPEEIQLLAPHGFGGSWRLMKEGVIVKKIRTVETLGAPPVKIK